MAQDTPETIYWCPVCDADVSLIDVRKHLQAHYIRSEVREESNELVDGLRDVAIKVLRANGIDYYKSGMVFTTKPKYFPSPKSELEKKTPSSKRKKKLPKTVRKSKKASEKTRGTWRGKHTPKMVGPGNRAKSSDWKTVK